MPAGDVTVTATFKDKVVSYSVITTNGVAADKEKAAKDETVKLTITIPDGQEIESVSYKVTGTETSVPVEKDADGNYTFKMPAGDVTVNVTFESASSETPVTPDPDAPVIPDSE